MTEREVYRDPYRAELVVVEPLPSIGRLDLIVDEDGLSVSARLTVDGARALRTALDEWLNGQ